NIPATRRRRAALVASVAFPEDPSCIGTAAYHTLVPMGTTNITTGSAHAAARHSAGVASPRIPIIGPGFGRIGPAIRLKQAGFQDVVVLERGNDVGGVWRDNTYPGCACDVQSHLYSFSFAPNPTWTRSFSPQPEILRYLQKVAADYDVK